MQRRNWVFPTTQLLIGGKAEGTANYALKLKKANAITNMNKDQLLQLISQQQKEINALKKENEDVEKANEILKDALGFFVIDRKKK